MDKKWFVIKSENNNYYTLESDKFDESYGEYISEYYEQGKAESKVSLYNSKVNKFFVFLEYKGDKKEISVEEFKGNYGEYIERINKISIDNYLLSVCDTKEEVEVHKEDFNKPIHYWAILHDEMENEFSVEEYDCSYGEYMYYTDHEYGVYRGPYESKQEAYEKLKEVQDSQREWLVIEGDGECWVSEYTGGRDVDYTGPHANIVGRYATEEQAQAEVNEYYKSIHKWLVIKGDFRYWVEEYTGGTYQEYTGAYSTVIGEYKTKEEAEQAKTEYEKEQEEWLLIGNFGDKIIRIRKYSGGYGNEYFDEKYGEFIICECKTEEEAKALKREKYRDYNKDELINIIYSGEELEFLDKELQSDKKFLMRLIREKCYNIKKILPYISEELRNDKEFMSYAIELDFKAIAYLGDKLKFDQKFILAMCVKVHVDADKEETLNNINEELKNNPDFINKAKNMNAYHLEKIDKELLANRDVVIEIIDFRRTSETEEVTEYLDKDLLNNKEFLLEVIERKGIFAIAYASEELRNNMEFIIAAVQCCGGDLEFNLEYALKYASEELKNDEKFMKEVEEVIKQAKYREEIKEKQEVLKEKNKEIEQLQQDEKDKNKQGETYGEE